MNPELSINKKMERLRRAIIQAEFERYLEESRERLEEAVKEFSKCLEGDQAFKGHMEVLRSRLLKVRRIRLRLDGSGKVRQPQVAKPTIKRRKRGKVKRSPRRGRQK